MRKAWSTHLILTDLVVGQVAVLAGQEGGGPELDGHVGHGVIGQVGFRQQVTEF